MMRVQDVSSQGKDAVGKLSQIVQVWSHFSLVDEAIADTVHRTILLRLLSSS